jgi:hypothetical protein
LYQRLKWVRACVRAWVSVATLTVLSPSAHRLTDWRHTITTTKAAKTLLGHTKPTTKAVKSAETTEALLGHTEAAAEAAETTETTEATKALLRHTKATEALLRHTETTKATEALLLLRHKVKLLPCWLIPTTLLATEAALLIAKTTYGETGHLTYLS